VKKEEGEKKESVIDQNKKEWYEATGVVIFQGGRLLSRRRRR